MRIVCNSRLPAVYTDKSQLDFTLFHDVTVNTGLQIRPCAGDLFSLFFNSLN